MQVLKEAHAKGEIDGALSLPLLRDMIFGAIEHQTWAFLREEGDFSVDETTDGITAVVFRGMQPVAVGAAGAADFAARMGRMKTAFSRIEARSVTADPQLPDPVAVRSPYHGRTLCRDRG